MRANLLILVFLLICTAVQAQSTRATLALRVIPQGEDGEVLAIPLQNITPFLAWSVVWAGDAPGLWVRFSADGREWLPWSFCEPDLHAAELPDRTVGQLRFEDASLRFFQLRSDVDVAEAVFHFYSPGPTTLPSAPDEISGELTAACPCPLPAFKNRADWCPAGNCPPAANPAFTSVTHLIVHHSATSNTASDWAAVVRSFWDFHVNVNGWADIGYNWLIDPNGVLYQGRSDNVLGAHFCGANGQTMGVCVIGNFTTVTPTAAALDQLRNLLAWKACNVGVDPLGMMLHPNSGLNLFHISGHRDGCSTECPGNAFYPMLPTTRLAVAGYIDNVCSITGVEDQNSQEDRLRIYPNPAGDLLTIELPAGARGGMVEIVQASSGIRLRREWHDAVETISLSVAALPAGLYQLRFRSTDGQERRAVFIKQGP